VVVASSMTLYGEGCGTCPIHGIVQPNLRAVKRLEQREWDTLCPHCSTPLSPAPTPETKLPNPTSVYAVSKRGQEEYCLAVGRAYGIPTVALRYFNIFGAGQALGNPYTGLVAIFCNRLLSGEPALIYEDGRQSRDLVHVRDIVQANILALKASEGDYQAFNVSSGELWTVAEVAELVRDALGVPGEIRVLHQYRAGDTRHCHADLSQIRTRLGYEPRVGLRAGLPEVVRWARSEAGVKCPNRPDSTGPAQAERELLAFGLLR
jgi:dTDP-L-rhamnose 4-epimerase